MVDKITAKFPLPDNMIPSPMLNGKIEQCELNDIVYVPHHRRKYDLVATRESLEAKGIGGLHLVLRHGWAATLFVSNSLHKVAHNGLNHTDFRFSEFPSAIEMVSDALKMDFGKFKLCSEVEFGVNIISENPERFLSLDQIYNNRHRPDPIKDKKKLCGVNFPPESSRLKIYSPSLVHPKLAISPNILRVEMVTKTAYLRKIKRRMVDLRTVNDLTKFEKMQTIGCNLVDMSKEVKQLDATLDSWEYEDLQIWYFFRDAKSKELERIRKEKKSTFYRHRNRFKEMQNEAQQHYYSNPDELPEKVAEKVVDLLHS